MPLTIMLIESRTVRMTTAAHAQVVCEEVPEVKRYGLKTKGKSRFLAGVVTPAQPHYLFGLLDANQDPHLGMAPPTLGIANSVGGYKVRAWLAAGRLALTRGLFRPQPTSEVVPEA